MYYLFIRFIYLWDRILLGPEFSAPIQTGPGAHPTSYTKGTGLFSAPIQTGPGAHPTPYTKGTGLFPVLKRLGRGVKHSPPFSVEVKEIVEFIPLLLLRAFMADYSLNCIFIYLLIYLFI